MGKPPVIETNEYLELKADIDLLKMMVSNIAITQEQIKCKAEESERTLKGKDGVTGLVAKVDKIYDLLLEDRKVAADKVVTDKAEHEASIVTFRVLVEKFGAPVITGVLMWLLITVLPQILALIAKAK